MGDNGFTSCEELEGVILLAYDEDGSSFARDDIGNVVSVRARASLRLEAIRSASDGYLVCLQLLQRSTSQQQQQQQQQQNQNQSEARRALVSFFALSTIAHFLSSLRVQSPNDRYSIRSTMLSLPSSQPTYITTKIAVVLALIIKSDYPHTWPTAFDELLRLSTVHPELFLRVLMALIDEVVVFEEGRTKTEVEKNSFIKDRIRGINTSPSSSPTSSPSTSPSEQESVMFKLFNAMITIVHSNTQSNPLMAKLTLSTLQHYLGWVDISLISSNNVIQTIFTSFGSPALACSAADCVLEIVNKGMDEELKLNLLQALNIFDVLSLVPLNSTDDSLSTKVSEIVNAVGLQLLSCFDNHEVIKKEEVSGVLLDRSMSMLFRCMSHGSCDVSSQVFPMVARYSQTLGRQVLEDEKRCSSPQSQLQSSPPRVFSAEKYLPQVLTLVYNQMCYPEDYEFNYDANDINDFTTTISSNSNSNNNNEEEEEDEIELHHIELRKLYTKLVKCKPEICLQFLCSALSNLSTPFNNAPFSSLEAALRLVFHYQEGISPKLANLFNVGTFPSVIMALHKSGLGSHEHPEIMILYLEISVRYCKILTSTADNKADLTSESQEMIVIILDCVSRGLQRKERKVRSRSCYLLVRFVKAMGDHLSLFLDRSLNGIQGLLAANRAANYTLTSVEDGNHLFEAIGLLLNMDSLSPETKLAQLSAFIMPQIASIKELLSSPSLVPHSAAANNIAILIGTIANLLKGFAKRNQSPELASIFGHCLSASMAALHALPTDSNIRPKTMMLIHRMVFLLEEGVLSYLPMFLNLLIVKSKEEDLSEVVQLMNQLMIQFQGKVAPALDGILQTFLRHCTELAPQTGSASQIEVQGLAVKKLYMLFLAHVVANDCTSVLVSSTNISCFPDVLNAMLDGLSLNDYTINKTCLLFFVKLCNFGFSNSSSDPRVSSMYWDFIYKSVFPGVIRMVANRDSFNIKDANCARVLNEAATLFFTVSQVRGMAEFGEFIKALGEFIGSAKDAEPMRSILRDFASCTTEAEMRKVMKQFVTNLTGVS